MLLSLAALALGIVGFSAGRTCWAEVRVLCLL
jgi:hypothetical protein